MIDALDKIGSCIAENAYFKIGQRVHYHMLIDNKLIGEIDRINITADAYNVFIEYSVHNDGNHVGLFSAYNLMLAKEQS